MLQRYTQMVIVELAQLILCSRLHSLEQRAARWLLQINERLDVGTSFGVTHEFLAEMIGAKRPPVTEVVSSLRDRGLIEYVRGAARVSDRQGLERVACECYRTIRDEHERLASRTTMVPLAANPSD